MGESQSTTTWTGPIAAMSKGAGNGSRHSEAGEGSARPIHVKRARAVDHAAAVAARLSSDTPLLRHAKPAGTREGATSAASRGDVRPRAPVRPQPDAMRATTGWNKCTIHKNMVAPQPTIDKKE